MTEYSLSKGYFKQLAKSLVPGMLINLLSPVFIYYVIVNMVNVPEVKGMFKLICTVYFIVSVLKEANKWRRVRRDWSSFKIEVTEEAVTKSQFKTPALRIGLEEINRMVESTGGLFIMTTDPNRFIFVPRALSEFDQLRERLLGIQPIEVSPINSITIPAQLAIRQHTRPGDISKLFFKKLAVYAGIILLAFVVIGVFLAVVIRRLSP